MEEAMKKFAKVMKALSDPGRIKIIKMLGHKVMCVCEMQSALGLAQSTVSKHLKILEEAGLIEFYKDGLWVNYRLSDGMDSPYASSMLGNLRHWLDDDPEMAELLKKLPEIRREIICGK